MKNYVWIIFLFICNGMQGQDPYALLEKIMAVYADNSGLSYEVHYKYYEDLDAMVPNETMDMTVATKGDAYYLQYNDYILTGEGKDHLVIDHVDKSIRLMQYAQQQSSPALKQFQKMAEAMGLHLEAITLSDETYKGLAFTAPDKSGTSIRLIYDPSNYHLVSTIIRIDLSNEQAAIYGLQKMRMEAHYTDYQEIEGRFPYRPAEIRKQYNDYTIF